MLIHNAHGGGAGTFCLLLLYSGYGGVCRRRHTSPIIAMALII